MTQQELMDAIYPDRERLKRICINTDFFMEIWKTYRDRNGYEPEFLCVHQVLITHNELIPRDKIVKIFR